MEIYAIKKLIECGDRLRDEEQFEGAFALYWISSEAIFVRCLVKCFWMRGADLKDAKKFVRRIDTNKVFVALSCATGKWFRGTDEKLRGIYVQQTAKSMRNSIFHNGVVPNRLALANMTNFLADFVAKPEKYWCEVPIHDFATGTDFQLGNPLADLRSEKRITKDRCSAEVLFNEWTTVNAERLAKASGGPNPMRVLLGNQPEGRKIEWANMEIAQTIIADFRWAFSDPFHVRQNQIRSQRTRERRIIT